MSTNGLLLHSDPPGPPPQFPGAYRPEGSRPEAPFDTPILVVEDEAMIAWMIENVLEDAGFTNVVIAANGAAARGEAQLKAPGLIVSDVNLGAGEDGIATARAICEAGPVPVIFVTGYADVRMRQRLERELPSAQLLRKPVDSAALVRAVMRALSS